MMLDKVIQSDKDVSLLLIPVPKQWFIDKVVWDGANVLVLDTTEYIIEFVPVTEVDEHTINEMLPVIVLMGELLQYLNELCLVCKLKTLLSHILTNQAKQSIILEIWV
jgi:hypothetical protein